MKKLVSIAVIAATPMFALTANANEVSPRYSIQFTQSAPVIDGDGNDAVWQNADAHTQFTFPWREQLAPATEFRALWDEQAVYFRYRVADNNIVIGSDPTRAILDSDRAEIFLAKDRALSAYYTMEVDAKARVYSAKASYDHNKRKIGTFDDTWRWAGLETKATVTDYGYLVEGKLPLQTLTDLNLWQDKQQSTLLCALMRAEFTRLPDGSIDMGWMTWIDPHTPKPNFHNPFTFAECVLEKN